MAREYAADRMRVNAVAPVVLSTPTLDRYAPPELVRQLAAAVPMRRSGDAQEVAGTILYLASAALSGYVTGETVEVNGGMWMGCAAPPSRCRARSATPTRHTVRTLCSPAAACGPRTDT